MTSPNDPATGRPFEDADTEGRDAKLRDDQPQLDDRRSDPDQEHDDTTEGSHAGGAAGVVLGGAAAGPLGAIAGGIVGAATAAATGGGPTDDGGAIDDTAREHGARVSRELDRDPAP